MLLGSYCVQCKPTLLLLLLLLYTTTVRDLLKSTRNGTQRNIMLLEPTMLSTVLISGFTKRIMRVPDREC